MIEVVIKPLQNNQHLQAQNKTKPSKLETLVFLNMARHLVTESLKGLRRGKKLPLEKKPLAGAKGAYVYLSLFPGTVQGISSG